MVRKRNNAFRAAEFWLRKGGRSLKKKEAPGYVPRLRGCCRIVPGDLKMAQPGGEVVVNLVGTQLGLKVAEVGFGVDHDQLEVEHLGEVLHVLSGDTVGIAGVVGAAGIDPGGAAGLEVGLVLPHSTGDGELG